MDLSPLTNFKYSRWRIRWLWPGLISENSNYFNVFCHTSQSCFDYEHVLGSIERFEKYWMYRCYGNYNIAIIKSEKGGNICKIATHVKNTLITAFVVYVLANE